MNQLDRFASGLAGVIVVFVLLSVLRGCWDTPPAQSPATLASGDSLRQQHERDLRAQDSLSHLLTVQQVALARADLRAAHALWLADSVRRSLPLPPDDTAATALAYWKARAHLDERSNDSLTDAMVSLRVEADSAMARTTRLFEARLASKDSVLQAADRHLADLTADNLRLAHGARCWYVRPLVPCLPRKAEGVALVALGAYGGYRLTR